MKVGVGSVVEHDGELVRVVEIQPGVVTMVTETDSHVPNASRVKALNPWDMTVYEIVCLFREYHPTIFREANPV